MKSSRIKAIEANESEIASDELPEGWDIRPVEDIFETFGGGTPSRGVSEYWGGDIPWLSSGDIKTDRIMSAGEFITSAGLENSSARMGRPGSVVVVVRSGILAHTLPVALLDFSAAINQDIKCFDSGSKGLNAWLALALRSSAQDILALNREGTTVQSVKYSTLREHRLRVPPLAEQRRIVAKIEDLLDHINSSRDHLAKVPKILKAFRQSVLAAACSGRLTEDWRIAEGPDSVDPALADSQAGRTLLPAEVTCPDTWALSTIRKLVPSIEAGENMRCEEHAPLNGEAGIVKISAVTWGEFDEKESKTLPDLMSFKPESQINHGDLLISRANTIELVGTVVLVHSIRNRLMLRDKILRLNALEEWKRWLLLFLRSRLGRHQIEGLATGNQMSMRNISQANLNRIVIPVPPLNEKREIVRRVEALFKLADTFEKRVEAATKRADKLTQAVLAKAFRGELVPTEAELARREGRAYERASALLGRLRATRQAESKRSTHKHRAGHISDNRRNLE